MEPSIQVRDDAGDGTRDAQKAPGSDGAVTGEQPLQMSIPALFERVAAANPERPAVVIEGAGLTYCQLNANANALAQLLIDQGVGSNALVGVCIERSLEMVVGLLAVLKTGAAYVPLDPEHPPARLHQMLSDTHCRWVLASRQMEKRLPPLPCTVIVPGEGMDAGHARPETNPKCAASPASLAYCMYTSGSTGVPKGILTTHAGVVRLVTAQNYAKLGAEDVLLQAAPLSFDASTFEIWGALLNGACLALAPPGPTNLHDMAAAVRRHRVTTVWLTASLFHRWVELGISELQGVRQLLAGGDSLRADLVRSAIEQLPDCQVINGYGPTETTTFAVCHRFPKDFSGSRAPLGVPIANTWVYVLDCQLTQVADGDVGELHIAGPGLARGYLNQPALTAERFVPDPFGPSGTRMYRTGDFVRRRPDGNLEFLGRQDRQVKVRGYRIELDEIELAILGHEGVQQAAVMATSAGSGEKRVVAYVVPKEGGGLDSETIRGWLARRLPDYMQPSHWHFLDTMPLNTSGKLARSALPPVPFDDPSTCPDFVPPATTLERTISDAWSKVLGVSRVGRFERFWALGGTSIQAIGIGHQLSRDHAAGRRLPLPLGNVSLCEYAELLQRALDSASEARTRGTQDLHSLCASRAQEQVWFMEQWGEAWKAYRFHARIDFHGPLVVPALESALQTLLERHEILRTTFVAVNGELHRNVAQSLELPLWTHDLSQLEPFQRDAALTHIIGDELGHRFDMGKPPLVRWCLVKLSPTHHMLLQSEHHNLHDGQSFRILMKELALLYSASVRGAQAQLPTIEAQYGDFCAEESAWIGSKDELAKVEAWSRALQPLGDQFCVFSDGPAEEQRFVGSQVRRQPHPALLAGVDAAAARVGVSRFSFMMAAFGMLCGGLSHRDRFAIGTALANRNQPKFQWTTGMFVNSVPIPMELRDLTFDALARQVGCHIDFALSHGDVPLSEIVQRTGLSSKLKGAAPFDVSFSFHDSLRLEESFEGLSVEVQEAVPNGSAKFDLNVIVMFGNPTPDAVELRFEFNSDRFDVDWVGRFADQYLEVLADLSAHPTTRLGNPSHLLALTEEHLQRCNGVAGNYGPASTMGALFEACAKRHAQQVALEYGDLNLNYAELASRVDALAELLVHKGVEPDELIGLCVQRSPEMVIGLLAVLKAGAAYLPLDPDLPRERLQFVMTDARVRRVLTQSALQHLVAGSAQVLCLDEPLPPAPWPSHSAPPAAGPDVDRLAYCIYTSGSTGKPKGAMISHRALFNRLMWMQQQYGLCPDDAVLQKTPFSFDVSVWEFLWPLLHGARLVLCEPGGHKDPEYLASMIERHSITTLHFVPSMLQAFLDSGVAGTCTQLRRVICSGESLAMAVQQRFFQVLPTVELHNLYGPTEATIDVSYWPCSVDSILRTVPIGRPVANTSLYILDEQLRPVVPGTQGELYIGGVQLARGYLHHPELTAERFVPNPFGPPGARLYRSGDLARTLHNGSIEYLGRTDHQVKLRGYRIELGEIDSALLTCEGVREAAVKLLDAPERGGPVLVAYVVVAQGGHVDESRLQARLASSLPFYMVPGLWVFLPKLPLTSSGKVDRNALPAPVQAHPAHASPGPRQDCAVLDAITKILRELLPDVQVGAEDDMVRMGLHSLLILRFVSRCKTEFGMPLKIRDVYRLGSPALLAEHVRKAQAAVA